MFKNIILKAPLSVIVVFSILIHPVAQGSSCASVFTKLKKVFNVKQSVNVIPYSQLADPQFFAQKMTEGMLLREGQDELFNFYISSFFSHPDAAHIYLPAVFDILKRYPNLSKLPVREQVIHFFDSSHQKVTIPEGFKNIIDSLKKTSSQLRSNLFQIEANYGFWIKLLDFSPLELDTALSKKEQQKQIKEHFINYLNTTPLDKQTRDFIKDNSMTYYERTITLFNALKIIRLSYLESRSKQAKKISQVMAELVHTIGFSKKSLIKLLNNSDLLLSVDFVHKILHEGDIIANDLGYRDFTDLKNDLDAKIPDVTVMLGEFLKNHSQYSDISASHPLKNEEKKETLRLRALSIQEAPYRSCLAGDCATRTYFFQGLDPNYLYFTLTDVEHKSSGQVTVVLGTSTNSKGVTIKTAFVDKIQQIPVVRLVTVLEAIRLSLKEQGYILGLPKLVGNETGLSNESLLRTYVTTHILPQLQNTLGSFKPHEYNDTQFVRPDLTTYSRAREQLNLLEFKVDKNTGATIAPGEFPVIQYADSKLNVQAFYDYVQSLKSSQNPSDHIKFINMISNLAMDPQYVWNEIYSVLSDNKFAFNARKQALFKLIQLHVKTLSVEDELSVSFLEKYIAFFSESEVKTIIGELSNWVNTLDYRRLFIHILTETPGYLDGITYFLRNTDKMSDNVSKKLRLIDEHPYGLIFSNVFLLLEASAIGDMHGVKKILARGFDINNTNNVGETALMAASERGHKTIVEFLLDQGATILFRNGAGQNSLTKALDHNHLELALFLLEKLYNPKSTKDFITQSVEHLVTEYERLFSARDIASLGISGNIQYKALIYAIYNGHKEIVQFLLDKGIDPNMADKENNLTALMRVAITKSERQADIVKLLLKAGADVNFKDDEGKTALWYATKNGDKNGIVPLLEEAGAIFDKPKRYVGSTVSSSLP